MFLSKLYRYHKGLFVLFVLFISIQVFLNFKRGMTATPFLHFGMFARPYTVPSQTNAFEIEVNGRPLRLINYYGKTVDQIIEPLYAFKVQHVKGVNLYHSHIKKYLDAFYLPSRAGTYDPTITKEQFRQWYIPYLSRLIDQPVHTLKVYFNTYEIKDANFILTHKSLFL